MGTDHFTHRWIRGGSSRDRAAALTGLGPAPMLLPVVNADQVLRGPYTAAGTIARALTPDVLARAEALVRRYDIELLTCAPELAAIVPNSRQTLTSMALPAERTRYYARLRTRRIAHGLVEFLRDGLPAGGPRMLVLEHVGRAEHTDVEFITAALRRIDPGALTIVVCTATDQPPDPALLAVLTEQTRLMDVENLLTRPIPGEAIGAWAGIPLPGEQSAGGNAARAAELAASYISGECTGDAADLVAAYGELGPEKRAELHDRRAAELMVDGERSLWFGAIPFHLERGTDPQRAAEVLLEAQDHAVMHGFYEAAVGYARRGIDLIADPEQEPARWWKHALHLGLALSVLGRTDEAMRVYDDARAISTDPRVHMAAAYSTAMLYTRHNQPGERDQTLAKAWLNSAIATASLIEDAGDRAFFGAFYRNGLALVEATLGRPDEALRLVDGCLDSLDRLLGPTEHLLHRCVLKNNRARVYVSLIRFDDALADYAVVIANDPNHAEHYLERGTILRKLGRFDEALADYGTAQRLSPPFPEIYYNRADLRMSQDDTAGALADFSYVIELSPDLVDAYVNRAGILLDQGRLEEAEADAVTGLRLDPDNPHLLVVLAQVHAERGEASRARRSYDRALTLDRNLLTALAGRAALAYDAGEFDSALVDLTRAVELDPEDPLIRYNRAFVYQARDRWDEALADLDIAIDAAADDPDITAARTACQANARAQVSPA